MMEYVITRSDELVHWGIKGQKWGVRRYENEDGTLTEAGKKRYAKSEKLATKEKITSEQIRKNAIKRGAIGASIGAGIGSMADSISRKIRFMDSTTDGLGLKDVNEAYKKNDYDFLDGFTYDDMNKGHVGTMATGKSIYSDTRSWYYPDVKFKNNGEAFHTLQRMTKNLLVAPAVGAAIGAGTGALGSVAVDKLHNARIDKAKKFVERYTSAYQKTLATEKVRREQVKAYKDEHPNTMLSDKEIGAMLRSGGNA